MVEPLPWHREVWERLAAHERLAHALLLVGPAGVGKRVFAAALARRLVCEEGRACGVCRSCRLALSDNHPDILPLVRAEGASEITVDSARGLQDFVALRPHIAARRVALILDADHLNRSAANAILKTLEEPPPGSYLVLVSDAPARLLPTVRSRCQRLALGRPNEAQALAYLADHQVPDAGARLALTHGAPLRAQALPSDAPDMAARLIKTLEDLAGGRLAVPDATEAWQGADPDVALALVTDIGAGLAESCLMGRSQRGFSDPVQLSLRRLADRLDLERVFRLWDEALDARALLGAPLDRRLVWDRIFMSVDTEQV